jgi:TRAP-type uncharacterized transport system fused permease subunit
MESNIRLLSRPYVVLVALLAILIAVAELGFQMGFNFYLYNLLTKLGLDLPWLRTTLDTQQVQALVLALSLAIVFIAYPLRKKEREKVPLYDLALAFLGFAAFFYVVVVFPELVYRVGRPTMLDIAMGILAIALLIEATRRTLGPVLPLVALAFLTYGMIYGIEAYSHVENPLARATTALVNHLYLAKEGIFGTPLFVMVTYVYAFVLFGAFLEKLGVGAYVIQLVLSLLGKKTRRPRQGCGSFKRAGWHVLGLVCCQRDGHRHLYHTHDEEVGLSPPFGRRSRGGCVHRRPAHAASYGSCGFRHGGVSRQAI